MRHDLHLCRLQEQRATEEADRLVRAQIRERRYQLVRAHNYYRQFVQEFRRKKIAKVVEEEQVFRRFFEQMLMQEKEYLRELQKWEHDDRQAKISLFEQKLSGLEHCQQIRMSLMKEKLKEEHDRRVAAARQERLLLAQRKRELRKLLEMRIREMQQCLLSSHDSAYFRERDGERSVLHSSGFVY
ncbi:unnamed protein product [Dicrocoelium dendriticum]|nr:unnamed protein product [Dicrocoelium dendriticum]